MDRNSRIYARSFVLTFASYVVLVFISNELLKRMSDEPWRYLIAILPVLPLIFTVRAFTRYLDNLDELQQRIQLQALGFAAGATAMLTLTYGFLENAGLPPLSMLWVFPLLCVLWGGASIVLTRRYQ